MKRVAFLLLSICIFLSMCACGKPADPWQEQYDLGVRYLSEGNYEEAIIAFTAAIEIDPKREEAYVGLADVYYATGDNEKAEEILGQITQQEDEEDAVEEYPLTELLYSLPVVEVAEFDCTYIPDYDWNGHNDGAAGAISHHIRIRENEGLSKVFCIYCWPNDISNERKEQLISKEFDEIKANGAMYNGVLVAGGVCPVYPDEVESTWHFLYVAVNENLEPVGYVEQVLVPPVASGDWYVPG